MQKINFINDSEPSLSEDILNELQENTEEAISDSENKLNNNIAKAILNPVVESIECKNIAPNLIIGDITNFATGSIPVFSASTTRMTFQQIFIDISNYTNLIASINSGFKICVILCDSANKVTRSTDYVASYSFTRANTEKYLYIKVKKDDNSEITSDDLSSVELQIEKGSTATSYTPFKKYGYNSQESMGSIVVDDISCKNKLNENGVIVNGVIGFPVNVKAGETYTISSNLPIYWFKITDYKDSPNRGAEWLGADGCTEHTFTCAESYPYIFIGIDQNNPYNLPTSLSSYTDYKLQVEKGTVATEYTPYKNFDNTDNGWVDIELANTYSFLDLVAYNGLQCKKIGNQVFLRGMLINSVANPVGYYATCGFVPEECRPKKPVYLICNQEGAPCNCTVETDGGIRVYNTKANSWIALDSMRFFID